MPAKKRKTKRQRPTRFLVRDSEWERIRKKYDIPEQADIAHIVFYRSLERGDSICKWPKEIQMTPDKLDTPADKLNRIRKVLSELAALLSPEERGKDGE